MIKSILTVAVVVCSYSYSMAESQHLRRRLSDGSNKEKARSSQPGDLDAHGRNLLKRCVKRTQSLVTNVVNAVEWSCVVRDDGMINIISCGITPNRTEKIVVPVNIGSNKVASIGSGALKKLKGIEEIEISNGVGFIARNAIAECPDLEIVSIPASVTCICDRAFSFCSNFGQCHKLREIRVAEQNPVYESRNGLLVAKEAKVLVACPKSVRSVCVPDGIVYRSCDAFSSCESIETLSLPSTFEGVIGSAWSSKKGRFVTKENVARINNRSLQRYLVVEGNQNYASCDGVLYNKDFSSLLGVPASMKNVTILQDIKNIGIVACSGCRHLVDFALPPAVTNIDSSAFDGCSLRRLEMADHVRLIGRRAFHFCSKLETVVISDSIESIGIDAFLGCSSLDKIIVKEGSEQHIVGLLRDSMLVKENLLRKDSSHIVSPSEKRWRNEFIDRLPRIVMNKADALLPGIGPMTNFLYISNGRGKYGSGAEFITAVRLEISRCARPKGASFSFCGHGFGDKCANDRVVGFRTFVRENEAVLPVTLKSPLGAITSIELKYSPLSRVVSEISTPRVSVLGNDVAGVSESFERWRDSMIAGGISEDRITKIENLPLNNLRSGTAYLQGTLYSGEESVCSWVAHNAVLDGGTNGIMFRLVLKPAGKFADEIDSESKKLKTIREKFGYCDCQKCRDAASVQRQKDVREENERRYQELCIREGRDRIRKVKFCGYHIGQPIEMNVCTNVSDAIFGNVRLKIGSCKHDICRRVDSISISTSPEYCQGKLGEVKEDEVNRQDCLKAAEFARKAEQLLGVKFHPDPIIASNCLARSVYSWKHDAQRAVVYLSDRTFRKNGIQKESCPSVTLEIFDGWIYDELGHEDFALRSKAEQITQRGVVQKTNDVETLPVVKLCAGSVDDLSRFNICGDLILGSTNGSPDHCSPANYCVGNVESPFHCRTSSKRMQIDGEWEDFSKNASLYYTHDRGKLFAVSISHRNEKFQTAEEYVEMYNKAIQRLERELNIKFKVVCNSVFEDGALKCFVSRWSDGALGVSVGITSYTVGDKKMDDCHPQVTIVFIDEKLKVQAKREGEWALMHRDIL